MMNEFIEQQKAIRSERSQANEKARPALDRLCEVLQGRSGQPYYLRELLYSLWNGKPASVLDIVHFDWEIRKDLVAVLLAFGSDDFFYKEVKAAVEKAGQWDWFLEAGDNVDKLREYVAATDRAAAYAKMEKSA